MHQLFSNTTSTAFYTLGRLTGITRGPEESMRAAWHMSWTINAGAHYSAVNRRPDIQKLIRDAVDRELASCNISTPSALFIEQQYYPLRCRYLQHRPL